MSKIYTKTGDRGTTALIGGTRVSKSALRVHCYGTVDELNAHIGLLRDQLESTGISTGLLQTIQDRLFVIGAALACDPHKAPKMAIPDLVEQDIRDLENAMDKMTEELPKMTHFVLPGGHPYVSQAHITRCVCRRAERDCVALLGPEEGKGKTAGKPATEGQEGTALEIAAANILRYLNRLSDYFFVLGRYIGLKLSVPEIKWIPRT